MARAIIRYALMGYYLYVFLMFIIIVQFRGLLSELFDDWEADMVFCSLWALLSLATFISMLFSSNKQEDYTKTDQKLLDDIDEGHPIKKPSPVLLLQILNLLFILAFNVLIRFWNFRMITRFLEVDAGVHNFVLVISGVVCIGIISHIGTGLR